MNVDPTRVEDLLRALHWRAPSSGALEETLKAALAERAALAKCRSRVSLHFIPRFLRLPLAACWTASLVFWWVTPRKAASHATMAAHSSLPDSASLMAQQEMTRQLTHELLVAFEGHGHQR